MASRSSFLLRVFVLVMYALANETDKDAYSCSTRHRKSWYALSSEERQLFITGYQQLRKNGKLSHLSTTYSAFTSMHRLQHSSLFFYMNEYFAYSLENAMRSLGDEYACFAIPYWDITVDADYTLQATNAPIFQTGLGGDGDNTNMHCVSAPNWNLCDANSESLYSACYWTPFAINCAETESSPQCCLKRSISSTTQSLPNSMELASVIHDNDNYKDFTMKVAPLIDAVYAFIGGSIDNAPMSNGMAPEDPLYFLIASFVGYLRAMWTECHHLQHDTNAYTPFLLETSETRTNKEAEYYSLDYVFDGDPPLMVRTMYDITNLGIVYDVGSLFTTAKMDEWCATDLTADWFVSETGNEKQSVVQKDVYMDEGEGDLTGIIEDESSETGRIIPSSKSEFMSFNTSLWSVIVWCSMFIFCFMVLCYMFTVKKDAETERFYAKHRKLAHVKIYGSVTAV